MSRLVSSGVATTLKVTAMPSFTRRLVGKSMSAPPWPPAYCALIAKVGAGVAGVVTMLAAAMAESVLRFTWSVTVKRKCSTAAASGAVKVVTAAAGALKVTRLAASCASAAPASSATCSQA